MDRGALQATVHRVAKSRTLLSDKHSTAHGNLSREAVFSPPALLFPINLRCAHSWSQRGRMDPQQGGSVESS